MIGMFGSSRSVLVAYTLPAFALFYGAVFLSEPVSLQKLAGLLLISGGVGLGSGVWRMARRTPAVQVP
jgi:drug/metabolite transporter (DMT)-like permease